MMPFTVPDPSRYPHRAPRAFTLLELLIVTLIIGVLVAIVLPALGTVRQRAKRVVCRETLHELSIGLKTYLEETNQVYPLSAQMPSVNVGNEALSKTLHLQVSSPKAFLCTADNQGYTRSSDQLPFPSYFDGETLSYDYNMPLGGRKIETAFMYPILHDSGIYVLEDFDNFHDVPARPATCKNILFADGHVGTVTDIATALGVPATP